MHTTDFDRIYGMTYEQEHALETGISGKGKLATYPGLWRISIRQVFSEREKNIKKYKLIRIMKTKTE